ncbi:hypothetical protein [Phytohabitans suffuscus]|nr:hypothetical protein [Phytohabitans suffuscus]
MILEQGDPFADLAVIVVEGAALERGQVAVGRSGGGLEFAFDGGELVA